MLNPLTSGKYQILQSPKLARVFLRLIWIPKKKTVRIVMLRSLKATPSVCLVLLRNLGAEVVLSHPVIFLNFSSSAGCSGCPEPSYLRSLMPSARYSPFFTSVSAFFVQCSHCRQSRSYPRRLSLPVDLYLNFEKSSLKHQIWRTAFLACKNKFQNCFFLSTQAVKIQFEIV